MITGILNAAPPLLAAAALLFGLYGFWRGLALRPHANEHRPPPTSKYFWWAND